MERRGKQEQVHGPHEPEHYALCSLQRSEQGRDTIHVLGVAALSRLLPHTPSPGACRSVIQLPRPPSVGPGRGAQPWWWGAEGAQSVWRGGSHLSNSALPIRRARRKSHPGPRAPPAPAPPWPRRSAGSTPPLPPPPPPPPPPAPSSAAGLPPGGAPRLRSARRA